MTLIIIVQVSIKKADKEKHSDSWDMKKNDEKKVSMMKNNKNDEYSKAVKVADEKKSQILKYLTSCHADNHAAEKFILENTIIYIKNDTWSDLALKLC